MLYREKFYQQRYIEKKKIFKYIYKYENHISHGLRHCVSVKAKYCCHMQFFFFKSVWMPLYASFSLLR